MKSKRLIILYYTDCMKHTDDTSNAVLHNRCYSCPEALSLFLITVLKRFLKQEENVLHFPVA